MRKSWFSEEQIIGILREHEAGVATAAETLSKIARDFRWRDMPQGLQFGLF